VSAMWLWRLEDRGTAYIRRSGRLQVPDGPTAFASLRRSFLRHRLAREPPFADRLHGRRDAVLSDNDPVCVQCSLGLTLRREKTGAPALTSVFAASANVTIGASTGIVTFFSPPL
jgi:hypothetical protein